MGTLHRMEATTATQEPAERKALPISVWGSEAARIAAREDEANLAPTAEMYAAAMQAVS